MKLKVRRKWYSKHFADLLLSQDRYIVAFGARGSGKTAHFILKFLAETFRATFENIYYCRREFETIRKTTFRDICIFLENNEELKQYFSYSTSNNGDMVFTNIITGNRFSPYGLNNPEKTKGLPNPTRIWVDEASECTREQILMLDETLRTPLAQTLQLAVSFNPVNVQHWLREQFFDKANAYKARPDYASKMLINHSTAKHNEFIDGAKYAANLERNYKGNQNLIDVNVHGLWGNPENEAPWMYAFDAGKHVADDLPILQSFPVYVSFDFNVEPVTAVVAQMTEVKSDKLSFLHVVKEYAINAQLQELCTRIKTDFAGHIIFVTGDAAGNARNVGFEQRNMTFYTIIQKHLGLSKKQMHINSRNLSHNDSRLLCNTVLHSFPKLLISRSGCPRLISDLELAEVDTGSATPGKLRKDRDGFKMDLLDGFRYLMQTYFSDYAKRFLPLK